MVRQFQKSRRWLGQWRRFPAVITRSILSLGIGILVSNVSFAQVRPLHLVAPRVTPIPGTAPPPPQPRLAPLGGTPWTHFGPAPVNIGGGVGWSGRIAGVAADPSNANVIYIAAAGGGVWKTTNGGTSWTPLTDTQPTLAMGAIALAPSNPNILYAGTGEANNSEDSAYGFGVLKSTDAGATWTLTGSSVFNLATISKIAVDPGNPNVAYVAVTPPGLPAGSFAYAGTPGIWKTTDGGATWANTTVGLTQSFEGYSDVAIDPRSGTVYMAIGSYFSGFGTNGVYRSTNGGASWAPSGNFPIGGNNGRISFALSPSNATAPATLYAAIARGVNSSPSGELLAIEKSSDGGTTWVPLTVPNYMSGQGWYNNSIAVSPTNANIVFAGGSGNGGGPTFIESINGGATWSNISQDGAGFFPHTDVHAFAFDATGHLLAGTDGGIWRLNNATPATLAWQSLNGNLETIQFTGISLHPTNPAIAYGGSQDNGTERTTGSTVWDLIRGGDGGFTRIDFSNPLTVYHTFTGASLERSDNGGATWLFRGINDGSGNFYVPYVMDPANSSRLLLGTNTLWETHSKGDSFTNKGSFTAPIDAIGLNGNTIYVAAGGSFAGANSIFVSTNDFANVTDRTPATPAHYADIAVDPTNAAHAFVVADRFSTPHVLVTTTTGTSWSDISGNLPNAPVNTVKYDPLTQIVYVGTDVGVYSSIGNGTWTQLGIGLPNAQVVNLDLNPQLGILGAGTHGRSMWTIVVNPLVTVTNVTSTVANGTYGVGAVIPVTVSFSGPVTVTGTPLLALNSGGTASYASGSGTSTLTFTYTVGAGQNTPHLDYTSASALTLNGGTIQDASTRAAVLTLPAPGSTGSLGANKSIVIDTVAPAVVSFNVLFGSTCYNLIGSGRFDLPWKITGIRVVFSKPIASADVNSLTGLTTTGFSGLGTNTLTWTISPITKGSFNTLLLGAGADAIRDAAGNPLAAFSQAFKVLYGDFNGDGFVTASDLVGVNNARSLPYNILADINGDGVVDANDVQIVRLLQGAHL